MDRPEAGLLAQNYETGDRNGREIEYDMQYQADIQLYNAVIVHIRVRKAEEDEDEKKKKGETEASWTRSK